PIGPTASAPRYTSSPDAPASPASTPMPKAAADGRPGTSPITSSRLSNPAACATTVTTSTGARRAASPPAKSAIPYVTADGRANGRDIGPRLQGSTDRTAKNSELDASRRRAGSTTKYPPGSD